MPDSRSPVESNWFGISLIRVLRRARLRPCTASLGQALVNGWVAEGETGLRDRSSKPKLSPRKIEPDKALAIIELRRRRLTQARIAASLAVSKSTVGRVLKRAGLSRLSDLDPSEPHGQRLVLPLQTLR